MKAIIINGSPRKNGNTMEMLKKTAEGIISEGVETKIINLYDYKFTGCKSCFACKIKNSKTNGLCVVKDELRPILEEAVEADIIVIGSPVYYGYPTGEVRSFIERLLFPLDTYMVDDSGKRMKVRDKFVASGLIYTMNCPEWYMEKVNYPILLGFTGEELGRLLGHNEVLYSCDTYQFKDYSRYDVNMFDEAKKREQHEKQFPIDLQNAYELGKRLVKKIKDI